MMICVTREQSLCIHDVVNAQGFAMHYRAIPNWKFSDVRGSIQQSKRMDWLLSLVQGFRSKDLSIWFTKRT